MDIINELELVIKKYENDFVGTCKMNWVEMARDCLRQIKYRDEQIKQLKEKSEKTGKWETIRYTTDCTWGVINHREETCSNCNKWQRERTPYCSKCGANMTKVEDNVK